MSVFVSVHCVVCQVVRVLECLLSDITSESVDNTISPEVGK